MILNSVLVGVCALPLVWGITPKQMLAAPRRSDPKPNPSGEWAVFTETTFDWDTEKSSSKWKLLNVATGNITDLRLSASGASEIVWIGPTKTSVLYLNSSNDAVAGGVTLWSTDLAATGAAATNTLVASLPAAFSGLKAVKTKEGGINFLVNALANRNGTVYNSQLVKKPTNTARLYKNIYPRHWDTYLAKERYAVFAGNLVLKDSKWSLSGELRNLLKDIPYSLTQPESPVQPFGDLGDYDLSPDGKRAVFLAKAPELPKANHTASYIYLVPHDGSSVATAINGPKGRQPKNVKGASASPRFSPNGRYVAYLQMDDISYESDRNKIYIADLDGKQPKIDSVAENWDRSPSSLTWEPSGKTIYAQAPDTGVVRLFPVPIDARPNYQPKNITDATSSVSSFGFLSNDQLLVSSSSQYSSKHITVVSKEGRKKSLFTAHTVDPELKGFGPSDVESIWYQGVLGMKQEAIVVKPTGFQPNKKYPWVMAVHGGPQGYWGNAWSTRWNLKVWADQGYVVVAPNPTGSTSYGQKLTDAIQNNWGSYPYEDLVNAWKYVRDNISYIDIERGVEAGASYGGYMTNWIQGHDLGRKFKALVTHDGTTTVAGKYVTDELFFIQHEFNGTSWEQPENYRRWDPINHVANWSTPHFIVHSDLDYRLPVAEGIMLFNILQTKGVPSRFLNFADENHWVSKRQNSLIWHTEIFNWINYYSGISDKLDDNAIGW